MHVILQKTSKSTGVWQCVVTRPLGRHQTKWWCLWKDNVHILHLPPQDLNVAYRSGHNGLLKIMAHFGSWKKKWHRTPCRNGITLEWSYLGWWGFQIQEKVSEFIAPYRSYIDVYSNTITSDYVTAQVWPLTQFFSVSFLWKLIYLPGGQINEPSSGKHYSPTFLQEMVTEFPVTSSYSIGPCGGPGTSRTLK